MLNDRANASHSTSVKGGVTVTPPPRMTFDKKYMPKVLHSGYDKLEFAAMGALPPKALDELEAAKTLAADLGREVKAHIGKLECLVRGYGTNATKGYSYLFSTGPLGVQYMVKRSVDRHQWNLYATATAQKLATEGLKKTVKDIWADFEALGADVLQESLSRLDYCVDVQMDKDGTPPSEGFCLQLENFIAHSRVTRSVVFSKEAPDGLDLRVNARKRIETVTLGKNPGLQIQVYDKRVQALTKRLLHYFEFWGKDVKTCPTVWRVELRFFKGHLKDWNIRTFEDVNNSIGTVALAALDHIRYVKNSNVSNVTRAELHPLWQTVRAQVRSGMIENDSGILRGRLIGVLRKEKIRESESAIAGRLAGLAYLSGMSYSQAKKELPEMAKRITEYALKTRADNLEQAYKKTKDRLYFLGESEHG